MQHRGFLLLSLLALLALTSAVAKKKGEAPPPPGCTARGVSPCTGPELCSPHVVDKVKKDGPGIECAEEWAWGPCTPSNKDCGVGFREGSCGAQTQRIRCRIPCNWKKEFGGQERGAQPRRRLGRLMKEAAGRAALTQAALPPADCKYKFENWGACDGGTGTKARYNAQCQETIRVTKPCTPKTKAKAKGTNSNYSIGASGLGPRESALERLAFVSSPATVSFRSVLPFLV
ncbi:hypothetical protein P7K49_021857 [Saguinus oedipus]|uniref:Midkine n=1 Tax=Saguinus oedipus TaxID=9490 RepID=A0ABQ9UUP3_SAGOE|nr:hypothetical protein P7K49_021857 [Saguinus oedipus]